MDNIGLKKKSFNELSLKELYEILRLRSEVFVVEQNCAYQDIDHLDDKCLHLWYEGNDMIVAYLRVYRKNDDTAVIGRVITRVRGKGLGLLLLQKGIDAAAKMDGIKHIFIEAQEYATGFYEKAGFKTCSKPFLMDGIPHVQMILDLKKKVYFAGSIRGGRDDKKIYEEMIAHIEETDIVLTKHVGNLALSAYEAEGSDRKIYEQDRTWLMEADLLIAECSTPSLGVGYELAFAERDGLPAHIFYQKGMNISAMIKGDPYFRLHPYSSKKELFKMIDIILERKEK